jgi:hypothetical protein
MVVYSINIYIFYLHMDILKHIIMINLQIGLGILLVLLLVYGRDIGYVRVYKCGVISIYCWGGKVEK